MFRLAASAQKGLAATEQNTLVCLFVCFFVLCQAILFHYLPHCLFVLSLWPLFIPSYTWHQIVPFLYIVFPSQVFMVMEGEVTVVLNTTQFLVGNLFIFMVVSLLSFFILSAKVSRGDSFFVPPHNTYNLLNLSSTQV